MNYFLLFFHGLCVPLYQAAPLKSDGPAYASAFWTVGESMDTVYSKTWAKYSKPLSSAATVKVVHLKKKRRQTYKTPMWVMTSGLPNQVYQRH